MLLKLSIRLHLFLLNLPLILFLITKYSFAIKNETFVPSPPPMFLPIQNMPRPSFVPEIPQIIEKSTNQTDGQKPILVVPNENPSESQNVEEKVQRKNKTTKYNETYAHIMMGLSGAAYVQSPNACVQRLMPDPKTWRLFSQHKQICDSANNTCLVYSIVSMERRELVVVFRGTRSKEQLFTEGWESLQPDLEFYGICKVNRYFAAALNVLWPNVEMALNDSKHKDFNVTFTGHSLGGALASLASIKAVLEGLTKSEQIKLYTFGQPRVGCSKFAAKHDELVPESFRVVFRSDVVPHMPPCAKNNQWALLDSFTSKPCDPSVPARAFHHGIEIWYPTAANYYIECIGIPRGEDFRCSDLLSFDLSKIENYISDHRHYLGHKLTAFASLDCDPTKKHLEETLEERDWEEEAKSEKKQKKKKEGILETIVEKVKMVGKIIGIL